MPCQIVFGYAYPHTSENVEKLLVNEKFEPDNDDDSECEWRYTRTCGMLGKLIFNDDPECHNIYVVFNTHYSEGTYNSDPINLRKLKRFKRRVRRLQKAGIIPEDAVFGIHTYH